MIKLLSKRWWIPIGARPERLKLEPKGEVGIFEHLRHSTWLFWYLISV